MNRNSASLVVGLLLLIGAGVWFFFNFERVTEREEVGWQGAARRDPFLAGERLLERMGLVVRQTHSVAEFDRLPPGATLLVFARWRDALRPRHVARLLAWVEAGGHLIVLAELPHKQDLLLDALRVRRVDVRARQPERPSEVTLPHAPAIMRVAFGHGQRLENSQPQAAYRIDEPTGTPAPALCARQGRRHRVDQPRVCQQRQHREARSRRVPVATDAFRAGLEAGSGGGAP